MPSTPATFSVASSSSTAATDSTITMQNGSTAASTPPAERYPAGG